VGEVFLSFGVKLAPANLGVSAWPEGMRLTRVPDRRQRMQGFNE